jgi:hypothetical protein
VSDERPNFETIRPLVTHSFPQAQLGNLEMHLPKDYEVSHNGKSADRMEGRYNEKDVHTTNIVAGVAWHTIYSQQ